MILGELARLERVLVVVMMPGHPRMLFVSRPDYGETEAGVISITDTRQPSCLFESRKAAEDIAFTLEQWGFKATVRRVSLVTTVEDARPAAPAGPTHGKYVSPNDVNQ